MCLFSGPIFSFLSLYYINAAGESVQLASVAEHFPVCLCFPVGFYLKLFDLSKDLKTQNKGEQGAGLSLQDHFSSQAKNPLNLNFAHHIGNIFRGPSVEGGREVANPWLWWIDFLWPSSCLAGRGHLCITVSPLGLGILFPSFIHLFIYFTGTQT